MDTGQETQTGGRLRRVLPYIDSETFLATYGDGLTNSNINASMRLPSAARRPGHGDGGAAAGPIRRADPGGT